MSKLNIPVIEVPLFIETITCLIDTIISKKMDSLMCPITQPNNLLAMLRTQSIVYTDFELHEENPAYVNSSHYHFKFSGLSTTEFGKDAAFWFADIRYKPLDANMIEVCCFANGTMRDLSMLLQRAEKGLPFMSIFPEYAPRGVMTLSEWEEFLARQDVDIARKTIEINVE